MQTKKPQNQANNLSGKPVITTDAKRSRSKPKSRFQILWDNAEKLKHANQTLETNLDALVERVRGEVGSAELEMGQTMRQQIDKLIVFAGRKSLAQWQMHVLDEWILSTMEILQPLGLVDDALRDSMAKLQAKAFGIDIDPNSELSAEAQLAIAMDAQLSGIDINLDDDDLLDDDEIDEVMQWFEEELKQSDAPKDNSEPFDWQGEPIDEALYDDTGTANRSASAQPETVFKTLFHRVARALHPDKEVDEEKRKLKQALMAQLLEARREKDLMTVFKLYQEYVSDTSDFGEHELAQLEGVLYDFIDLELQRKMDITSKSYLHEVVYADFYSDDPTKVDRAIQRKIKDIKQRKDASATFSKTVTSLQKLKPYLEARYDNMPRYF